MPPSISGAMSGGTHDLYSAAVIAEGGRAGLAACRSRADACPHAVGSASSTHISTGNGRRSRGCVGCFRIEGPGVQLFSRIEGSHFTVLGMPLLPVLDYLRVRGVLTS